MCMQFPIPSLSPENKKEKQHISSLSCPEVLENAAQYCTTAHSSKGKQLHTAHIERTAMQVSVKCLKSHLHVAQALVVWCALLYLNGCPSKVCELVSKVRQFTSHVMKPFQEKDFSFMPVETGWVKKIKTQATFF